MIDSVRATSPAPIPESLHPGVDLQVDGVSAQIALRPEADLLETRQDRRQSQLTIDLDLVFAARRQDQDLGFDPSVSQCGGLCEACDRDPLHPSFDQPPGDPDRTVTVGVRFDHGHDLGIAEPSPQTLEVARKSVEVDLDPSAGRGEARISNQAWRPRLTIRRVAATRRGRAARSW